MARPQVFISSTYYDLKSVRDDIARFLREAGYESIRHEIGAIPYARNEKLESSCYREVENCDILVCIIGGRFGTASTTASGSITQNELRSAYEKGKQVFIFVDKLVFSEWHFYQNNKLLENAKYSAVNDKKIFEFIEEVSQLSAGNPLFPFDTSSEIISILREQLAGLFQRLLSEQTLLQHRRLFEELKSSITTVGELAKFLSDKTTNDQGAIAQVLLTDHPVFAALKTSMKNKYRIFFSDLSELDQWAAGARSLKPVDEEIWDDKEYREWFKHERDVDGVKSLHLLKIYSGLFDLSGRLRPISKAAWKSEFVSFEKRKLRTEEDDELFNLSNPET